METRILSDIALYGSLIMSTNETDFPANPSIGTIIIKNQCLYAYIKIGGLETWYPFASKTDSYIHVQGIASTTWTVYHNLGTTDIWYQIKDTDGNLMIAPKTDIDNNSFTIELTSAMAGTCIVVAPQSIDVPEVKASLINIGSGSVILSSAGVEVGNVSITSNDITISGNPVLTSASIAQQIADAVATKDNSDEITEGTNNLYFTNTRARAAISVTDNGGDGGLSYDNTTGVISYTGPSDSEVRAHLSSGNGISYNSTSGAIAVDTTVVATVANLNSEITRATNTESTLTSSLNSEITRATNAEATIAANVLVEQTRAENAEATLTASVLTEKTRALAAESTLTTSLNTEVNRATNSESTINASLLSEITRASSAESTIASNVLVEKTRALGAEASLATSILDEKTRAMTAEAAFASGINALGNAFNYVGTLSGGASSGAAYDLASLATEGKDAGDYYKVAAAGYFKVGSGTAFYANLNDGLVWNLSNGVDIIDNTNSTVSGTTSFVAVTGSADTGFVVDVDSAFKTRMSTAESDILVEKTRANNAESTLTSSLNSEITRASNAESTLTSALNSEITRSTNAESTLTSSLNSEITRALAAESTLQSNVNLKAPIASPTFTGTVTAPTIAGTHLGLNATLSTVSSTNSLQMGTKTVIQDITGSTFISSNAYFNTTWKYKLAGGAAHNLSMSAGILTYKYAASVGAADADITWTTLLTVGTSGDLTIPGGLIASGSTGISLTNGVSNLIKYNNVGVAVPAFTTRSAGTKIVLSDTVAASAVDYAIGISDSTLWNSVATTANKFEWYGGTTLAATLTGTGNLTIPGAANVASIATAISQIITTSTTTTSTTATTVSTFASATYRSASYDVQITSGTSYTSLTIKVIHDDTNVTLLQTNEMSIGSSLGTFDASITTGALNLVFTAASATSTTVKVVQTAITV